MKIKLSNQKSIIVITGPESSGKTTLVERLREQHSLPIVEEFARKYLEQNGPKYDYSDLQKIGKCQIMQEEDKHKKFPLILCDTDIITIDIWAKEVFGKPISLENNLAANKLYLLCLPDIPWEPDPLRENRSDRDRLFDVYEEYLQSNGLDYQILSKSDRDAICL